MARNPKLEEIVNVINRERTIGVEIEFLIPTDPQIEEDIRTGIASRGGRYSLYSDKIVKMSDDYLIDVRSGYREPWDPWWQIKYDVSVEKPGYVGLEIVSPIITWSQRGQIETICRMLKENGCIVNETAGLHIHHGVKGDYQPKDFLRLINIYKSLESIIDGLVDETRRKHRNDYCYGMNPISPKESKEIMNWAKETDLSHEEVKTFVFTYMDYVQRAFDRKTSFYLSHARYVKLNIASYVNHGTVEFRHHHGTLDYDEIIHWIVFTQRMVETAKADIDFRDVPKNWVEGLWMLRISTRNEAKEFIAARMHYSKQRAIYAVF